MWKVRHCCLHQQERASYVDIVLICELLYVRFFNIHIPRYACVVNDDIQLEFLRLRMLEMIFGHQDNMRGTGFRAHICLHRDGLNAVCFLQPSSELFGLGCGRFGGVVEDEGAAFASQVFADSCTNAFGVLADSLGNISRNIELFLTS